MATALKINFKKAYKGDFIIIATYDNGRLLECQNITNKRTWKWSFENLSGLIDKGDIVQHDDDSFSDKRERKEPVKD